MIWRLRRRWSMRKTIAVLLAIAILFGETIPSNEIPIIPVAHATMRERPKQPREHIEPEEADSQYEKIIV